MTRCRNCSVRVGGAAKAGRAGLAPALRRRSRSCSSTSKQGDVEQTAEQLPQPRHRGAYDRQTSWSKFRASHSGRRFTPDPALAATAGSMSSPPSAAMRPSRCSVCGIEPGMRASELQRHDVVCHAVARAPRRRPCAIALRGVGLGLPAPVQERGALERHRPRGPAPRRPWLRRRLLQQRGVGERLRVEEEQIHAAAELLGDPSPRRRVGRVVERDEQRVRAAGRVRGEPDRLQKQERSASGQAMVTMVVAARRASQCSSR